MEDSLRATLKLLKELGFEEFYSTREIKIENQPSGLSEKNLQKSEEDKFELLLRLYEKNKNCCRCELCHSRTRIVFYDGNPYSPVVFVGEAPGEEEDKKGKPFVGRAGKLLTRILEEIGLKREKIYITNVCKCRPPKNRKPLPKEMQTCLNVFLKRELEIVKPKVICCLGSTAAEAFLGKNVKITKMRGRFYQNPLYPKAKIFLTYHPAYVLRNMGALKTFKEDLKKLKDFIDSISQ